jgi:molybdopterin-guanine dinucleotide biosynthesis protein A
VAGGEWKLISALEDAAREMAKADGRSAEQVISVLQVDENLHLYERETRARDGEPRHVLTAAQIAAKPRWFNNLNTPEEFAVAERNIAALDT